MKNVYFFFFILLFVNGCDENPVLTNEGIASSFELRDVSGVKKTIFKSGEDFKMIFLVKNLTGKDLYYGKDSGPGSF